MGIAQSLSAPGLGGAGRPACILVLFFIFMHAATFSVSLAATQPAEAIGIAAAIKKEVVGKRDENKRDLSKGDSVFQNEVIEAGRESEAEFIFKDDTRLALGPNSRVLLDKFIYDRDKKSGEIILNIVAGSFRFITGLADKTAYRIKTPVATIGVRGTVFDGYVNDKGEVAVLLIDGEIEVCSEKCRPIKRKGRFFRILRNGLIKGPHLWDASFFNKIGLATAFPFVGRRLIIDPIRRFNPRKLLRKASLIPRKILKKSSRAGREVLKAPGRGARKLGRGVKNIGRKTGRAIRRLKPF